MLAKKIAKFDELVSEIKLEIQSDNEQRVYELDKELSLIWKSLLEFEPQSEEQRRQLIRFLVSQAFETLGEYETAHKVKQKLLSLIDPEEQ